MTKQQGIEAIVKACRQEFTARGAQGSLDMRVWGEQRGPLSTLGINPIMLNQMGLADAFLRIGEYATPAPAQGPDIVHARGELGLWWTRNPNALRDSLNENFLSPENQITADLEV